MKDWMNRARTLQFGNYVMATYNIYASADGREFEYILQRLGSELGRELAKYGYTPNLETLKITTSDDLSNLAVNIGAKLQAEFNESPVAFCYALDEEVQKLRDLLANLLETKEEECPTSLQSNETDSI